VCATCPQNAVNSSRTGKGKACSYKKRVIVVSPGNLNGPAFAMDVAAMGMFGDDEPNQRLFNMKSYIEALRANGLIAPAVVTRLTFDGEESVPKLYFTPVRVLTAEEFTTVETRVKDPEILAMLQDIDNNTEAGKPVGQPTAPAPAPTPQPLGPPLTNPAEMNPAPAPDPAAPQPTTRRRGRPPASATPVAAAPAQPTAAPVNGGGQAGFDFGVVPATPAPAAPAAPAPQAAAGGFTIDLDDLDL
jgi:hypothetical protein